jgi:hypothetical protein
VSHHDRFNGGNQSGATAGGEVSVKAFLAFPKKAIRNFMTQTISYPSIQEDDRPTLVIAKDLIVAAKEFPDAIKIAECNVKAIVIKKEKP